MWPLRCSAAKEVNPFVAKSIQEKVKIVNERGLHARASARFAKTADQFEARITVSKDGMEVCGTSIMGLLLLVASKGESITISASGDGAEEALSVLVTLVKSRFEEDV